MTKPKARRNADKAGPGQSQALKNVQRAVKRPGSASSVWSRNGQDGMVHESKRPAHGSEAREGGGQESEHP